MTIKQFSFLNWKLKDMSEDLDSVFLPRSDSWISVGICLSNIWNTGRLSLQWRRKAVYSPFDVNMKFNVIVDGFVW